MLLQYNINLVMKMSILCLPVEIIDIIADNLRDEDLFYLAISSKNAYHKVLQLNFVDTLRNRFNKFGKTYSEREKIWEVISLLQQTNSYIAKINTYINDIILYKCDYDNVCYTTIYSIYNGSIYHISRTNCYLCDILTCGDEIVTTIDNGYTMYANGPCIRDYILIRRREYISLNKKDLNIIV